MRFTRRKGTEMITQTNKVNLIPEYGLPVTVHVSQFDAGSRTLTFKLLDESTTFTIPAGMTATFNGVKPDGYVFTYAMTVNSGAGTVSVDVTEQMTAVAGDVLCEVALFLSDERLGTANLTLSVERSPLSGGIVSDSDIPAIEDAIALLTAVEDIDQIINALVITEQRADDAETAATSAQNSASHAAGSEAAANTYKEQAKEYRDEAAAVVGPALYSLMVDTDGYIALHYSGV